MTINVAHQYLILHYTLDGGNPLHTSSYPLTVKKVKIHQGHRRGPKKWKKNNFTDIMGPGHAQCISKSFLEESPCQSHCDTYSLYYTTCDLDLTASRMEFATGLNRLTILRHFLERSGEARERSSRQFHPSPSLWAFLQTETLFKWEMLPSFLFSEVFHQVHSCTKSNEHLESLKIRLTEIWRRGKNRIFQTFSFKCYPPRLRPKKITAVASNEISFWMLLAHFQGGASFQRAKKIHPLLGGSSQVVSGNINHGDRFRPKTCGNVPSS